MDFAQLAGLGLSPNQVLSDGSGYTRLLMAKTGQVMPSGDLNSKRLRQAFLTPSSRVQPEELMGVPFSAAVPNAMQPMAGEFMGGRLVNAGRTQFFSPVMPPPTGTATSNIASTKPGAPMAQNPMAAAMMGAPTSALPRYATGGVIPPGGSGLVGDATGNPQDEEKVDALPGGGVRVTPITAPTITAQQVAVPKFQQATVAPLPKMGAAPAMAHSAYDTYQKASAALAPGGALSEQTIEHNADQIHPSFWRKALGTAAGIGLGAFSLNPNLGIAVHDSIVNHPRNEYLDRMNQERAGAMTDLKALTGGVQAEENRNQDLWKQYTDTANYNLTRGTQQNQLGLRGTEVNNEAMNYGARIEDANATRAQQALGANANMQMQAQEANNQNALGVQRNQIENRIAAANATRARADATRAQNQLAQHGINEATQAAAAQMMSLPLDQRAAWLQKNIVGLQASGVQVDQLTRLEKYADRVTKSGTGNAALDALAKSLGWAPEQLQPTPQPQPQAAPQATPQPTPSGNPNDPLGLY